VNSWINLTALWQIVVVGLLAGAGLPALFAVGLRALSLRGGRVAPAGESERVIGGSPLGMAAAVLCFAVVLAAVGWSIYFIVKSG
jgi:hypothetical protein